MFESTCEMARETFLNPSGFPQHQPLTYDISSRLCLLHDWSFHHCVLEKNIVAHDIAESVTSDRHYHSYIASGGPYWVQQRIEKEARA